MASFGDIQLDNGNSLANQFTQDNSRRDAGAKTQVNAERDALLAALDALGGKQTTDDRIKYAGEYFQFPARYRDNIPAVRSFLDEYERAQRAKTAFTKFFKARPHDGAAAFERALKRLFGTVGAGIPTVTMFGSTPPRRIDVQTSLNTSMSVPWGEISFEPLSATFELGAARDDDGQLVFAVSVTAPKREQKRISALFQVVEDELKQRSIYRGQAIAVRGGGNSEPKFMDLTGVDPSKVVYSQAVYRKLAASLWAPIQHTEKLKAAGQVLRTKTLLEGPFGTGKSMAGGLTAQIAVDNGWTYIHVPPGERIESALELARVYGPAVVWVEDVDTIAGGNEDRKRVVSVLEALDGITSKVPGGLIVGMTTNHVEKLDPAVLRPGRIDSIIHVAEPDRGAFEGIVKAVLPHGDPDTLDYDALWGQMGPTVDPSGKELDKGMLPAFIVGSVQDAVRFALSRSGGESSAITTQDILDAASGLRRTFELQQKALTAPVQIDPLEAAVERVLERTMERAAMMDGDGDVGYGYSYTFAKEDTRPRIKEGKKHIS